MSMVDSNIRSIFVVSFGQFEIGNKSAGDLRVGVKKRTRSIENNAPINSKLQHPPPGHTPGI